MKAVLISIKPEYVEKIASGEKTIEVRKTRPKLEVPFKCYIYMSQGTYKDLGTYSDWIYENRMRVIGEFVCDRTVGYYPYGLRGFDLSNKVLKNMCLSNKDLNKYGKLDKVYGWHISQLKIYDEPKYLSEFYVEGDCDCMSCKNCFWFDRGNGYNIEDDCYLAYKCAELHKSFKPITRPPQSWQYVENLGV